MLGREKYLGIAVRNFVRVHKNGQLVKEHITPIETHSLGENFSPISYVLLSTVLP